MINVYTHPFLASEQVHEMPTDPWTCVELLCEDTKQTEWESIVDCQRCGLEFLDGH